jgi:outer membrane protein OmpA-like peptidoglycan-associated protein
MDLPVNAIIRDRETDEWLQGVGVTVKDSRDGVILFMGTTDEKGITQGQIPDRRYGDDVNIEVTFKRKGYFTKTIRVDFRVWMFLDQTLTGPEGVGMSPVLTGIDMAKAMNLRPIYFDYREHKIRSDAAGELDLVAQVMRTNPGIRIDLRSHTDSRASTEYNDALSQRRANSSRQYLINEGVEADRITAKGYGERQLVNNCGDGMECSEEQHQENRRTEFIITECKECGLADGQ